MKPLFSSLILTCALLTSQSATAVEVADVTVKETISPLEQTLTLNGAGTRSKFFMDLYVGSLYLAAPQQQTDEVLKAPQATIRLNIISGMITAEKMQDAITDGFDAATQGNTQEIAPQIAEFMALFSDEIKEGDQFTLATSKAAGVSAFKNNKLQATIEGEAFRQALLNIWLGDDPAQTSLKEAMLGE